MGKNADRARAYAAELRKAAEKLPEQAYMPTWRNIVSRIMQGAVNLSPVNRGTLRSGWHLSIGSPSEKDTGEAGKSPADVLREADEVLAKLELGQGVWIQNNVPYARVYEEGLFIPKDPGPTDWSHITNDRVRKHLQKTRKSTNLIEHGFHVVAPEGMLAAAVQQVAEELAAGRL